MEFIKDQEKRILLAAISREKRVIKEHPELEELLPVIERLDHYFMYDRLFKRIYNQALEDFEVKIKECCSIAGSCDYEDIERIKEQLKRNNS